MPHSSIPASVAEITNGALMALSCVGVVFFCMYLNRAWRAQNLSIQPRFFTYENKTALGLLILFLGLAVKTGSAWWSLHLFTHGEKARFPLLGNVTIAGTLLSILGAIITIRALSRYRWSRWTWWWLAFGSIAFGIGFAI